MSVSTSFKQGEILELLPPAAQACDKKLREVGGIGKAVLGGDYLFDQIGDAFSNEGEDRPEIAFAPNGVLLEGVELFLTDGFDDGHLFELFIKAWGQLRGGL